MGKVHIFQRYSQRENWVTNNTLLFLSRLQDYNNKKFEKVINAILQENNLILNIGVNFSQQGRGANSVPDGIISQDEFKIAIETKLFDNFSLDQLKNHVKTLSNMRGKNSILLALSKSEVSTEIKSQVISYLKSINSDIKFASISFSGLIDLVSQNIANYEIDFLEVIDEFQEFCNETKLIADETDYMLVVTVGTSLKENMKYGLYYEPVTRNHNTNFKYLGLYSGKSIVAIGEVLYRVEADLHEDEIRINKVVPDVKVSDDIQSRIVEMIKNTSYYDIRKDHKFYVVDTFHKTNYKKNSFGSLRGTKYFKISDILDGKPGMSGSELAKIVNDKEWD